MLNSDIASDLYGKGENLRERLTEFVARLCSQQTITEEQFRILVRESMASVSVRFMRRQLADNDEYIESFL